MQGMVDLPSLDIFIASLSAPLNANQRCVGWVCGGIIGWPLALSLNVLLSRAAPNASFSPEILELRTRLPISPFLECHFAATKACGCPAVGGSPGGSWAREERVRTLCRCVWAASVPHRGVGSPCVRICVTCLHCSSSCLHFMLSLSVLFCLLSSLLYHPILPTFPFLHLPHPTPVTHHLHSPVSSGSLGSWYFEGIREGCLLG